jgi:hypothetical protein
VDVFVNHFKLNQKGEIVHDSVGHDEQKKQVDDTDYDSEEEEEEGD